MGDREWHDPDAGDGGSGEVEGGPVRRDECNRWRGPPGAGLARFPSTPRASRPTATHTPGRVGLRPKRKPTKPSAASVSATRPRPAPPAEAKGDTAVVGPGQAQQPKTPMCWPGTRSATIAALDAWSATTAQNPQSAPPRREARAASPLTLRSGRRWAPPMRARHDNSQRRAEVRAPTPRPRSGAGSLCEKDSGQG